jgi:hypothetical protein
LHGNLLAEATKKKASGSEGTEQSALAHLLEFEDVCNALCAVYDELDAFLCAWAAWELDPALLFDGQAVIKQCEDQRRAQCGQQFKFRQLKASTFRGYLNAVARIHAASQPETPFVPSSETQLPRLQKLMAAALTRQATKKAIGEAAHPPEEILQPAELPGILDTVQWSRPFDGSWVCHSCKPR